MRLIRTECGRIWKNLVYMLFLVLLFMDWHQNFAGVTSEEIGKAEGTKPEEGLIQFDRPLLKEPSESDDFFGLKYMENPDKIMRGAMDRLLSEYKANLYATYPFGYYKAVSLDREGQGRVLSILCEVTGLDGEQLMNLPDGYFPSVNGTVIHFSADAENQDPRAGFGINIPTEDGDVQNTDKEKVFIPQISYGAFKARMLELEGMIGRGSNYSMEMLITYFGLEEMTYEEAAEEYGQTIHTDRLSGGFARLFCDSMASAAGLLPAFMAAYLWLRDLASKSREVLYAKKISSMKLVFFRYLAGVIMFMMPVLLLTLESFFPLLKFACKNGYSMDWLAYVKYSICWLLPTAMASLALGTFLTVLTDSPVAVLVQLVWWFIDRGVTGLMGDTGLLTFMVRHNTLRGHEIIREQADVILANRLIYVFLSIGSLWLTGIVLEKKRSGNFDCWNFYAKLYARFTKCLRKISEKGIYAKCL